MSVGRAQFVKGSEYFGLHAALGFDDLVAEPVEVLFGCWLVAFGHDRFSSGSGWDAGRAARPRCDYSRMRPPRS